MAVELALELVAKNGSLTFSTLTLSRFRGLLLFEDDVCDELEIFPVDEDAETVTVPPSGGS